MKSLCISLLVLLLILFPTFSLSQDTTSIWSHGFHKKLGRIDSKGTILDDSNVQDFGKQIGRVREGIIYNDPNGGMPVGRIDKEGKIWDSAAGGKPIGRWEDGKVYNRSDRGGKIIGVSKNKNGAAYFLLKEKIDNK